MICNGWAILSREASRLEGSIKRVQVPRLGEVFCKAWEHDLNISSIPDLLGVSRPTFYKMLEEYTTKLNMEIRYVPNVYAMGYRIVVVESTQRNSGDGVLAFNLGGLKTLRAVYVKNDMVDDVIEMMETMGARVRGPLAVSRVYCGASMFTPERYTIARLSSDERIVAQELTERLGNIKEMARRLGISWQRATSAFRGLRSKGALIAPIYYKGARSSDYIGALIEVDRMPSRSSLSMLLDGSSVVVLTGERERPPYMIAIVARAGSILSLVEEAINGVLDYNVVNVYLSRKHPLPPLKGSHVMAYRKDDGRETRYAVPYPTIRTRKQDMLE